MEKFGRLVISELWDRPIEHHDLLAKGYWKTPGLQDLQAALVNLPEDQKQLVRRCVIEALNTGLHGLLSALQDAHNLKQGIEVMADNQNVAEISDGLQGEPYGGNGWIAKYGSIPRGSERPDQPEE